MSDSRGAIRKFLDSFRRPTQSHFWLNKLEEDLPKNTVPERVTHPSTPIPIASGPEVSAKPVLAGPGPAAPTSDKKVTFSSESNSTKILVAPIPTKPKKTEDRIDLYINGLNMKALDNEVLRHLDLPLGDPLDKLEPVIAYNKNRNLLMSSKEDALAESTEVTYQYKSSEKSSPTSGL